MRTDRRKYIRKLIVAFRNFANVPLKMCKISDNSKYSTLHLRMDIMQRNWSLTVESKGKGVPTHVINVKCSCTLGYPRYEMNVTGQGQLRTPAAIPPRKSLRYPVNRRPFGPQSISVRFGDKNFFPPCLYSKSESSRPVFLKLFSIWKLLKELFISWGTPAHENGGRNLRDGC